MNKTVERLEDAAEGAAADRELTASQMLSQAREAMGLSQDQVAQELYLTPAYIRLIDSNEIDKIAKQAFVRGYLRSYAKLVNVDDDEVVARFEIDQGGTTQKIEIRGVTQEFLGSTNFTGPVFQTGVLGLIGLIVIISLVWYLSSAEDETVVTSPAVTTTSNTASNSSTVEQQDAESAQQESAFRAFQSQVGEQASDETLDALNQSESANQEQAPVETSTSTLVLTSADKQAILDNMPETKAVVESPEPLLVKPDLPTPELAEATVASKKITVQRQESVVRVTAGGDDELKFTFTDECWVEIEDASGKSIYGDLNRNGDELIVMGTAPFEVLFGKAPAVTLEFNGEPIDLGPHTTSVETAKVKVGS